MAVRIYGNREIKTLSGEATRPTSARVREALFNIWQGRVLGCRWLDLCAGSGAMGAEALCRGASAVVGIEKSAAACQIVQQNWQKVAQADQSFQVLRGDVIKQLQRMAVDLPLDHSDQSELEGGFDFVYFDPPYASNLYHPVLNQIGNFLRAKGEVAVEYSRVHWQPTQLPANLQIIREKRYGSTHLVFLQSNTSDKYL